MSNKSKMKVVWICHFANDEINSFISPEKYVPDFAPWVSMAIKTVENCENIELHVIAPWFYKPGVNQVTVRGVNYHFFYPYVLNRNRLLYNKYFSLDYFSDFRRSRKLIKGIIDQVKPDVIHLFGIENPYYSASFFDLIDHYPIILSVQGFVSKGSNLQKNRTLRKRALIEKAILTQSYISFYETSFQANDIKRVNPDIELFYHTYGSYEISPIEPEPEKKYDLVFFAKVCKDKGIIDLIDALTALRTKYSNISLLVVGGGNPAPFKEYASSRGLQNNIIWAGFQNTREDVFRLASQASISVLPTHNDIIPGTVMESMFLKIPVITNNVGSIPIINEDGNEYIIMNECGDIPQLASAIDKLLSDRKLREDMAEKAYFRAKELFAPSNEKLQKCLLQGYTRCQELFCERKSHIQTNS